MIELGEGLDLIQRENICGFMTTDWAALYLHGNREVILSFRWKEHLNSFLLEWLVS